jgi:hypothetical protein
VGNLDPKAFSSALGDFERSSLTALDLVQHGLSGDAESLGGFGERHEPVRDVGHEATADLIG